MDEDHEEEDESHEGMEGWRVELKEGREKKSRYGGREGGGECSPELFWVGPVPAVAVHPPHVGHQVRALHVLLR